MDQDQSQRIQSVLEPDRDILVGGGPAGGKKAVRLYLLSLLKNSRRTDVQTYSSTRK